MDSAPAPAHELKPYLPEDDEYNDQREIGDQAVWSVSSCKLGFGVNHLFDGKLDTYWQSDGHQPHLVNIQFPKRTSFLNILIYVDHKIDESYTPSKISVRLGSHFNDLQEVVVQEWNEPVGYQEIPLTDAKNCPYKAFMIQIAVLSNHQNGRDTHLRLVKVNAPAQNFTSEGLPPFSSKQLKTFSSIL